MSNSILYSLFLTLILVSCSQKQTQNMKTTKKEKPKTVKMLVGTYTSENSEGVYAVDFNLEDGSLSNKRLVVKTENPSFVTQSKNGESVYVVNENDPGGITSFVWDEKESILIEKETVLSQGAHPCFLELNETKGLLAVANYSSGNIVMYSVKGDRLLNPQVRTHEGSSVVLPNQASAHAHCSKFGKDNKYLYVADLGIDKIMGYAIDTKNKLGEKFTVLEMDKGDGPRHFVFHPTKPLVFIISELSNTVTVATIDKEAGVFTRIDKKSTLPDGFEGQSYCADIHISQDGKFLYASNRGHNSIAIFYIAENGSINLIATEDVHGDWPRNFKLSPNGAFLLVANQKSDNITVFKVDKATGTLLFTGVDLKISKPVCLLFSNRRL